MPDLAYREAYTVNSSEAGLCVACDPYVPRERSAENRGRLFDNLDHLCYNLTCMHK